jgi:hypothetical protein
MGGEIERKGLIEREENKYKGEIKRVGEIESGRK